MNVLRKEATTATQTLPVIIQTDHLLVRVILALMETEIFVKVCSICVCLPLYIFTLPNLQERYPEKP